jgi:hypothetical protein
LEDFSAEAVRSQIAEAQKIASGSGSEQDIAEAKIELEVSLYWLPMPTHYLLRSGSGELAGCSEVEDGFCAIQATLDQGYVHHVS